MSFSTKVIMGIDILPMSSSSAKQKPKYAALIFSKDRVLFKSEEISIRKLIKILNKYKPDYLAMDNIWELAPNQETLQNFLKKLHPVKLVQVTGSPTQMKPIHILAKRCGMHLTSHPTPIETAEICARLIQIGIGYEVCLFEKETQIRIARSRSIGPGGWSQNRYRRHSHAMILQSTREIQTQLDEQGIEYDLSVRKADFGLDKSVFTVYVPLNEVISFIKPYSGSTIQVKIEPIKRKEIEFIPLSALKEETHPLKSIIVGIDPGTTTGIAILDLNGRPLALRSGKEISRRDLIRYIAGFGSAVIIATDVSQLPRYVEKVANTFNSIVFRPKKPFKVIEKKELVSSYLKNSKKKVSDAHIRDALACALKAYYSYSKIFDKIHKKIQEMNVDVSIDKIKILVIRGYSIYDAISILTFKPEEKEEASEEIQQIETDSTKKLNKKIYQLIDRNLRLKYQLEESNTRTIELEREIKLHKDQISTLEEKLEKVKSKKYYQLRGERLIRAQTTEINQLRNITLKLKDKIVELENKISKYERRSVILEELEKKKLAGKITILKVIENFTKECLETVELYPNDVLYLLNGSGGGSSTAEQLIAVANGLRAIITNTLSHEAYEQFKNAGITIVPIKEIKDNLKLKEGIYYIDKAFLEQKLKLFKEKQYELNRQEVETWLQNLISNYRNR